MCPLWPTYRYTIGFGFGRADLKFLLVKIQSFGPDWKRSSRNLKRPTLKIKRENPNLKEEQSHNINFTDKDFCLSGCLLDKIQWQCNRIHDKWLSRRMFQLAALGQCQNRTGSRALVQTGSQHCDLGCCWAEGSSSV